MLDYLENHLSEAYYYQHDRKERIFSSLSLPASVIIVVIGGVFYYVDILLPVKGLLDLQTGALAALTVSFISIVFASYNVLKAAHNNTYEYIASPIDLKDHAKELEAYYTQIGDANAADAAKADLQEALVAQYAQSASRNAGVNEERLYYRNRSFKAISVAIVLLALTATLNAVSVNTAKGENSVERQTEAGLRTEPPNTTGTEAPASEAEAAADAVGDGGREAGQDRDQDQDL